MLLPIPPIQQTAFRFFIVLTISLIFTVYFNISTPLSPSKAQAQGAASIYSAVSGPTSSETDYEAVEHYIGPSDFLLDHSGIFFYIAEQDARKLRRVRVDGSQNAELLSLPFKPNKLCFFPDETRLAVVGGEENGRLAIVEIARPMDRDSDAVTEADGNSRNTEKDSQDVTENISGNISPESNPLQPVPMRILQEIPVGHTPSEVAVKKAENNQELLYVLNRFNGTAIEIDAATGKTTRTWDVGREPFCGKLTPDGRYFVIANRITDKPANRSFTCANVRVIDLIQGTVAKTDLLNGQNLLNDMTLSPDGRYAFISCVQESYLSITSQVSGAWMESNGFLAVDIEKCELVDIFFLDDEMLGAANPWGLACSDDGETLAVSLSGTDELVFLPLQRIIKKIEERPENARPGFGAYMYMSFAKGEIQRPFRTRVKFGLKGLRQVLTRGNDFYVLSYFDDSICKATLHLNPPYSHYPNAHVSQEKPPRTIAAVQADTEKAADSPDTDPDNVKTTPTDDSESEAASFDELYAETVSDDQPDTGPPLRFTELEPRKPLEGIIVERSFARLGPKPLLTARRRGEILFHDATACFEHWQSCVTCHPDGRIDGFNWDLLNDGTGNLKNTKSLLLSHETPPSMISGVRADAETAVRAGFVHILFTSVKEENACAVDEYLSSLKPVPSPYLIDGKLSESAQRGKILFESDRIGCSSCHPEPLFTDLQLHRVGSQDPNDFLNKFDTPTLIEVWRTAPYLNTGAYTTIRDVLQTGKHGMKDGCFENLPPQEQDDLIEYVLSL
ncbi:MAG: hypothetical protein IKW74_03085 [Thermoguttaceae bacterium]|nr:hypothetical protein [Thermoguttaceae bacterium]